ncbi:TPA: DUF1642 domain-containing protein [Streptococcus pneumoniae]|nr:DUF1642 domain-containing protein [Streptococcus pneumoniae]
MNKQELTKAVIELPVDCSGSRPKIDKLTTLELIKLLKEPGKVTIPQFVADWIESSKQEKRNLRNALNNGNEKMRLWLLDQENYDLFARAWLDGYEVGKEKKYKITLLNRNDGDLYLVNQNADLADKYGHFSPVVLLFTKCTNFSEKCYKLTEKEVVSHDFGWVFDCPGIKIEEVE